MGLSPKQTSKKDFRSISLPCRSHPSVYRIEKLLNKFKTWESTSSLSNLQPSAEIICSGVCQLTELYECLDDQLVKTCHPQTSSISHNQNVKWTDELLDHVSISFLDIFGNTSDLMLQTKQHVRDLWCDLRRNGGPTMDNIIHDYIVFRKKHRKDVQRCLTNLNQLDNFIGHFPLPADLENHHLTSVVRVFREVNASTAVILRLLLKFLGIPILQTRSSSRWTAISKYISSGKVVPEEKVGTNANELQRLDNALFRYSTSCKFEFIQHVQKKVVEFEVSVDDINSHLESMLRRLIATRTSLLNLVSFY